MKKHLTNFVSLHTYIRKETREYFHSRQTTGTGVQNRLTIVRYRRESSTNGVGRTTPNIQHRRWGNTGTTLISSKYYTR